MIWNFFGPKDNYIGRFGIEWQTKEWAYTIHFFPKTYTWGYQYCFGVYIYALGPLLEFDYSRLE